MELKTLYGGYGGYGGFSITLYNIFYMENF
jgi:hypothetical protein